MDVTNLSALSRGVSDLARDAAYVAVGLGVLGYQRAQVQRVGIQERLAGDLSLTSLAESAAHFVEARIQPIEEMLRHRPGA